MADVFLSYAREDLRVAHAIARLLQDRGWSVWWDRELVPGSSFDEVIERELTNAAAVLVVWSAKSVASHWVRSEANAAVERGAMIPVLIETTKLPLRFSMVQAVDLTTWKGNADDPGIEQLFAGVEALAGPPPPPGQVWQPPNQRIEPPIAGTRDAVDVREWSAAPTVVVEGVEGGWSSTSGTPTIPAVPAPPAPLPRGRRRTIIAALAGVAALAAVIVLVVLLGGDGDDEEAGGATTLVDTTAADTTAVETTGDPNTTIDGSGSEDENLARGASGPRVRELQEWLRDSGIAPDLVADAVFGPLTETALLTFERDYGLPEDATIRVDSEDWNLLRSLAELAGSSETTVPAEVAPVPDVYDLPVDSARATLESQGFDVDLTSGCSNSVGEGRVRQVTYSDGTTDVVVVGKASEVDATEAPADALLTILVASGPCSQ